MTISDPKRKPVWTCAVRYLRNFRYLGQTRYGKFNPSGRKNRDHHHEDTDKNGRTNPDTKAAVFRNVHRLMCHIKMNHT